MQTQRPAARSVIVTTAQQARAEAVTKLAESQAMLRSIIENNLAAIAVVDLAGNEVMSNRAWDELLGDAGAGGALALTPVRADDAPVREEIAIDRDGQVRYLDTVRFPLTDASGTAYAVCAMVLDITQRREAAHVLERAVKDLDSFATVASHDLQAPLHTITAFTDIIEERYRDALGDKGLEYLGAIRTATNRGSELVSDLLDFARAGSATLEAEDADPEAVLAGVLESLEGLRRDRDATITTQPLPQVSVDRKQLRQLLQNLVLNALKYVPPDRHPEVEISATATNSMIEFTIRDNGSGVPEHLRERIFDMFFRGHNEDGLSGTGLGLALCQRIVERHGGRIWVEPASGVGTLFKFTLPSAGSGSDSSPPI